MIWEDPTQDLTLHSLLAFAKAFSVFYLKYKILHHP